MSTTTSYDVRDLLQDVAGDPQAWHRLDEPTELVAAIQPLADVARLLGDLTMHQSLRAEAALQEVVEKVEWEVRARAPERATGTALAMQQVVPLLREAGRTRDPVPVMQLALSTADLAVLARCAHLLAAAALALGSVRLCRLYVLAARTVDGTQGR